jgi:hypothetical protein
MIASDFQSERHLTCAARPRAARGAGEHRISALTNRFASRAARNAANSKYGQVPQYRKNADDDDDDPHDLFHAAVERELVDEIEQQNDDQKDDQDADQKRHGSLPPC